MDIKILVILSVLVSARGQFFEDRRCRCVCPSPSMVLNSTVTRQIFTGNVAPGQCNCEGVVLPLIRQDLEGKLHLYCPRCECVFQTRNTTLIMGVVFMMLTGISMSIIYMLSLTWLRSLVDPNTDRRLERVLDITRHIIEDERRGDVEEERLLMGDDQEDN